MEKQAPTRKRLPAQKERYVYTDVLDEEHEETAQLREVARFLLEYHEKHCQKKLHDTGRT